MNCSALEGWLPYKLSGQANQQLCRWLYVGEKKFTEPFFDETILKCLSHPSNSGFFRSVSCLKFLKECALKIDCLHPAVFIFHVSRCGSTLVSQLASLLPQNIVLSEVPFLDELLRLPFKSKNICSDEADMHFHAALSFYGQKREAVQQNLIIKTDSWHILFYKRLRRLFPEVPFVLLYRDPVEVMLSHQKKRGMHSVPGVIEPEIFGFDKIEVTKWNLDEYLAKVLEKYFEAYLKMVRTDHNVITVNYNEGIVNIMKKIFNKTGISFSNEEWQRMIERAGYDAKYPGKKFSAPDTIRHNPAYLQKSFALYKELDGVHSHNESLE